MFFRTFCCKLSPRFDLAGVEARHYANQVSYRKMYDCKFTTKIAPYFRMRRTKKSAVPLKLPARTARTAQSPITAGKPFLPTQADLCNLRSAKPLKSDADLCACRPRTLRRLSLKARKKSYSFSQRFLYLFFAIIAVFPQFVNRSHLF